MSLGGGLACRLFTHFCDSNYCSAIRLLLQLANDNMNIQGENKIKSVDWVVLDGFL